MLTYNTVEYSEPDIQISDITMVHKNSFIKSRKYDKYLNGRKNYGLVYCVSGKGVFDFGYEKVTLSAGEMMLLVKGSKYSVRNKEEDPFVHYIVNFDVSFLEANGNATVWGLMNEEKRYKATNDYFIDFERPFKKMYEDWWNRYCGRLMIVRGHLYSLLGDYFRSADANLDVSETEKKLRKAKSFLTYVNGKLSCAEIAAECGFSEVHFRRLWKQYFGGSPMEYRVDWQITFAKVMLCYESSNSVKAVAEMVGFEDPNYFARVFKKKVNMTPTEYIEQMKACGKFKYNDKVEEIVYY